MAVGGMYGSGMVVGGMYGSRRYVCTVVGGMYGSGMYGSRWIVW